MSGVDVLREHDHGARVGRVNASWEGLDGSLRIAGTISDPEAMREVRSGKLRGLSLGTSVTQDMAGNALLRIQDEVSICSEPRRGGCYIDKIDGAKVHTRQQFSASDRRGLVCIGVCVMAEPVAEGMVDAPSSGVSKETHQQMRSENDSLREQLASLKAKHSVYEQRQRDQLASMKAECVEFTDSIAKAHPEHTELSMMSRWASEMDAGDSIETNMGIGRLISCASAQFKRTRDEASQLTEKSSTLATTCQKLEQVEADLGAKVKRIEELEGLVNERTEAATKLQEELAKHGMIKEKLDFSKKSSREVVPEAAASSSASSSRTAPAANMNDALFSFVTGGGRGGLKIGQSSTAHHFLGSTPGDSDIANALRI